MIGGILWILFSGCARPVSPSPEPESEPIKLSYPTESETIFSPLEIQGEAIGGWFFEASFPIMLLDEQGNRIGISYAEAQADWMTPEFVPFKAHLEFETTVNQTGTLVFEKANPSGLPENEDRFEIRLQLSPALETPASAEEQMTVKVFFPNNQKDPEMQDCSNVFPVERKIPKTVGVARAALNELFKGPTQAEATAGHITSLNEGIEIQRLFIENGVAYVDFNSKLEEAVGGSCRVVSIRSQIEQTLLQFSTVKEVVISIDGRTEDILQP